MAEEKKATVHVNITMTAKIAYKTLCDNDIVKITFNMSDVPVDAKDSMIKLSAVNNIADDFEKGTGVIRATDSEGDKPCFIAIDSVKKFTVLNVEIKKGE